MCHSSITDIFRQNYDDYMRANEKGDEKGSKEERDVA